MGGSDEPATVFLLIYFDTIGLFELENLSQTILEGISFHYFLIGIVTKTRLPESTSF